MKSNKKEDLADKFLSPCSIFIVDVNIIRARMQIFETQIRKYGGRLIENPSDKDSITHLLVDCDLGEETVQKLISKLVVDDGRVKILRTKWLSACIKQKKLVDTKPFEVKLPKKMDNEEIDGGSQKSQERKRQSSAERSEGSYGKSVFDQTTDSGDSEDDGDQSKQSTSNRSDSPSPPKKPRFACEHASTDPAFSPAGHNQVIIDKLQILAEGYKSTNDKWRALSYEKAIQTLKKYPKPISSYQELKNMRGIGNRLADKIWEIHESGDLQKAVEFQHNEKVQAMNIFTNIFGVGPTIAEHWYAQGMRTLKDVEEKAKLTYQQRIGVRYYDEFLRRMDRSEAAEIVNLVYDAVKEMNPDLIVQAGGSFRRGCKTCGDVDFIITHPDGHSQEGVLAPLVKTLTERGFLTDDLIECDVDGNQRKYMGVCKLPGEEKLHRRIDIIAVPYSEYATSLIYFTGSVYFVRSIYGMAKHKGWRLNQHGLHGGVMRQGGEKLNDGYLIPTPTEESVFEKMGIPYRTPEERDLI